MFVQEEKIFAGKVLKIHICTMEGAEWLEEVTEDTTIEKLKERCLKHVSYIYLDGVNADINVTLIRDVTFRY